MIAAIETTEQYGRNGQAGIGLLSELDGKTTVVYAHSVQDAVEWLTKFPLYEGATVDRFENGVCIVTSAWRDRDKTWDAFFEDDNYPEKKADYARDRAIVRPVNTIYENGGFEGYKKE